MNQSDIFTLGLLTAILILLIGVLVGYQIGRQHRRSTYRQIRAGLEEEVAAWKAAYRDALGRIREQSPFRKYL